MKQFVGVKRRKASLIKGVPTCIHYATPKPCGNKQSRIRWNFQPSFHAKRVLSRIANIQEIILIPVEQSVTARRSRVHQTHLCSSYIALIRAAVGGRTSSTKMKMAFSGASLIRFRITYTNCPTVRSWSNRVGGIQVPKMCLLTDGTRYFFLSMVGISVRSAFSQMTYATKLFSKVHPVASYEAYWDAIWILLSYPLSFGLALLCYIEVIQHVPLHYCGCGGVPKGCSSLNLDLIFTVKLVVW